MTYKDEGLGMVPSETRSLNESPRRPRIQFGLSSLLGFVTVCAILAGLVRLAERPPWLPEPLGTTEKLAAAFFAAICVASLLAGRPQAERKPVRFVAACFAAIALLVLLLFSAAAAWHTVGLDVILYWCVVPVTLIPPLLCGVRKFSASICASVLLAALTSPLWGTQIAYAIRLDMLRAEVAAIAEHLESVKRNTGEYPADLSGYEFQRPMFQPLVTYFPPDSPSNDYVVDCELYDGDPTDRSYGPRHGWCFNPD